MLKKFFNNTRNPRGLGGAFMLWSMNHGHSALSEWGLSHLVPGESDTVLDIGCGGGKNLARLCEMSPKGKIHGLDYAELSVSKSLMLNQKAVAAGKVTVTQGSVSNMPYHDNLFDIITAFETVYFWPDLPSDLKEVARVLKPGGTLLICNEIVRGEDGREPQNGFVKMLNLKTYSAKKYKEILTLAGFASMQTFTSQKGKAMCVLAVNGGG